MLSRVFICKEISILKASTIQTDAGGCALVCTPTAIPWRQQLWTVVASNHVTAKSLMGCSHPHLTPWVSVIFISSISLYSLVKAWLATTKQDVQIRKLQTTLTPALSSGKLGIIKAYPALDFTDWQLRVWVFCDFCLFLAYIIYILTVFGHRWGT